MHVQRLLAWGSPVAAWLPRRFAERVADGCGDLAATRRTPAARAAGANLRQLLGRPAEPAHVRGMYRTYARYYLAMMRLAHRPARAAVGHVAWRGAEALEATLARGRGALVLSAHFGNWDLLGMALASRFGAIGVFVESLPEDLLRFYSRVRRRHGVVPIPAGRPSRLPFELLARNGLLGLAADRAFGTRRERVPCGDGMLWVPSGGIRLALRAGAGIHAAFAVRQEDGFAVHIGNDLRPTSAASLEAGTGDVARAFARELQGLVRARPEQWCLLRPLQDAEPEAVAAGERGAA